MSPVIWILIGVLIGWLLRAWVRPAAPIAKQSEPEPVIKPLVPPSNLEDRRLTEQIEAEKKSSEHDSAA